jgi:WYL domain-containing protein
MIDRQKLLQDLSRNILEVSFVKVNGEPRTLKCTLMPQHLPSGTDMNHLRDMHLKEENSHKVVCWDVQAGSWKSFHIDSVTYAQSTGVD